MNKKNLIRLVSIILTFIILREILRLLTGDYFTSVIPGWHTTIYSTEWSLTIGASILIISTGIIIGLYKLLNNGIKRIWKSTEKSKKQHANKV